MRQPGRSATGLGLRPGPSPARGLFDNDVAEHAQLRVSGNRAEIVVLALLQGDRVRLRRTGREERGALRPDYVEVVDRMATVLHRDRDLARDERRLRQLETEVAHDHAER